jgi:hypothetical protein
MSNYLEKEINEIRNNWFPDHQATLVGSEGMQVLHWKQPGTSFYYAKYIMSGSDLIVTGDIGEAVFSLTCKATLENITDFHLSYLMGKLVAHSGSRWSYNEQKALDELTEWYEDWRDEEEDVRLIQFHDELRTAAMEWSMSEHFRQDVYNIWQNTDCHYIDGEEADMIADFGQEMPMRFIAYFEGLKMAYDQLKNRGEIN